MKYKTIKKSLAELANEYQILNDREMLNYIGGNDTKTMYAVFNRAMGVITFYYDNGTPNNSSDDITLFAGVAHNNVASGCSPWPSGSYTMYDQSGHHGHDSIQDSPNGSFGVSGIYRAESFYDEDADRIRYGMGIHSGRENKDFENRVTEGCIRVEQDTMDKIDSYTASGYLFTTLNVI